MFLLFYFVESAAEIVISVGYIIRKIDLKYTQMYFAGVLLELVLEIQSIKSRVVALPEYSSIALAHNVVTSTHPSIRTIMHTDPDAVVVHEPSLAIVQNREFVSPSHFVPHLKVKPTGVPRGIYVIVQ